MILAGIDIGTNTLRLLIADVDRRTFRTLHSDRKTTRLGQDLDRTGTLSREAEDRSIAAILEFRAQIRAFSVEHIAAVGTSALRNAANSAEFIQTLERQTGIAVSIISGKEEARLTLTGIKHALKGHALSSAMIFDIGGGSTEMIVHRSGSEPVIDSLPLGAVYLTERFLRHDPPTENEVTELRAAVRQELGGVQAAITRVSHIQICVGTGGTITTLAAIDQKLPEYNSDAIHNYELSSASIGSTVQRLSKASHGELRRIQGLEPGREDIIFAGAVIAQELLMLSGCPGLVVSDWGLREGILLDLYDKISKQHRAWIGD